MFFVNVVRGDPMTARQRIAVGGGLPAALSYPLPAPHIHTAGGTCHASDRILLVYNSRLSACAAACTAAKGCPGPRRGADPHPNRRRPGRRALPRCVGQLSGMGAGRFLVGGGVHAGNRHNAGQYTVDWRNSRAGAGAALRRCALPQRLLSVQPPLHRHAGAGPRV